MQRWRCTRACRRLVTAIACSYSWLALVYPDGAVGADTAAQRLSVTQWGIVGRIEERVRDLGRAGARVEHAGGRAEILEELMKAVDTGGQCDGASLGALKVASEAVSLPTERSGP